MTVNRAAADPAGDVAPRPRARARLDLMTIAERLFATHGVDSVSLRQIASAAGYSNTTTVQYHFGTKEGLCAAIIDHRMEGIDARTHELLANAPDSDLDALVDAMVRPLLELEPESHYVEFLSRYISAIGQNEAAYAAAVRYEAWNRLRHSIDVALAELTPEVRTLRMSFASSLMVHAIAERRRWASTRSRRGTSSDDFERELLASVAAILRGPSATSAS